MFGPVGAAAGAGAGAATSDGSEAAVASGWSGWSPCGVATATASPALRSALDDGAQVVLQGNSSSNALALIDACVRLIPGVMGKEEIMLPLNLMARYVTTPGDELTITLAT